LTALLLSLFLDCIKEEQKTTTLSRFPTNTIWSVESIVTILATFSYVGFVAFFLPAIVHNDHLLFFYQYLQPKAETVFFNAHQCVFMFF